MTDIHAAAEIIAASRRAHTALAPLAPELAPRSETEGYLIQDALHGLLAADFGDRVGYKIGCTSPVMQQYLDIPHPCGGGVFAHGVHPSGAVLNARDFVRVGEAIEAYLPAIEIVDDRYVKWENLGAPTLVADDFFAAGCVLGAAVARSAAPDLLAVIGRAVINGVEIGQGTGADVLGHPHNALAWLANHLAAAGKTLRAGEIVLTGSLVKTVWLKAGDRVTMDLSGLGEVHVTFG